MQALRVLDVSENRLESLPESIGLLRQLRELLAASNELRRRDAPPRLPPYARTPSRLQPCAARPTCDLQPATLRARPRSV